MQQVLLDAVVMTDYGQLDLTWGDYGGFDGDFSRIFAGQVNGLVGAADPGGVYLNLARRSGGSDVTVTLHDEAPTLPAEAWGDVVEVSTDVPAGATVRWSTWAGESGGELPLPAGTYRLRVSAQGRDAGHDGEFDDGVVDRYRLDLWMAPRRGDEILRCESANGAYWHAENGGRESRS